MKNIRLFHQTLDYEKEKMELKYPTVSLDKEGKKVHYVLREKPNRIIATYSVTEDQVGQDVLLASDLGNCSDIILDGKSLSTPISINSGVVTPTSYGVYSSMTFTDDSWVVSPSQPWEITFDKPLQEGDTIGLSIFMPEYNERQSVFVPYETMVSQGVLTPIEPNNTQKFTCIYTTALMGIIFNILMYAFTPIDENGTITEDNFIGATYEIKSGGLPSNVIVKPTEVTTYTVEYRFSKENVINTVIKNISENATSVDLSSFNTSNVTDMSNMFSGCTSLTSVTFGDGFDTSNVTNMNSMFCRCSSLTSVTFGSKFDTSNVTDMGVMFWGCASLTSLDLSNFDTSNVTDMSSMFSGCNSLTSLDLSDFDASKVTNTLNMFGGCNGLKSLKYFKKTPSKCIGLSRMGIESVDLSSWDASNVTDMSGMFSDCAKLTSVAFGDNFDTSNVTNMSDMFFNCYGLTSLDLSNFDTSNVTDMSYMFYMCNGLTSIDLSNFDTSNVTDMSVMFGYCNSLTSLDLSNFDTSNVTNMSGMFSSCSGLTSLDLNNFDTSNVTDMSGMFSGCSGLTSLDLSNFDTSNVTNMSNIFNNCNGLTLLDLSNFDTSNVTNMEYMFYGCSGFASLDLSNFDTSNVTNMSSMFGACTNLTSVTMVNSVSKITNANGMFYSVTTTGIFYYNGDYDYSKIIAKLPSKWTAVPIDYENGETV